MSAVQVFRVGRRWRLGFRHFPPVGYTLRDGRSGVLGRVVWLAIARFEVRFSLGGAR